MKATRPTPLGALVRGLAAGAAGAAAQDVFFLLTRRIAPETPKGAFTPPERDQIEETATQTVARRFAGCFMQRPLSPEAKARGATVVHYAFGAALGGAYGLLAETVPSLRTPAGGLAYGLGVWVVGDDLALPVFRLSAWPNAYPLKTHAYAIGAHFVYGITVAAAYGALRPRSIAVAAAMLWAARQNLRLTTRLPAAARPVARAVIASVARARAAEPLSAVAEAAGSA